MNNYLEKMRAYLVGFSVKKTTRQGIKYVRSLNNTERAIILLIISGVVIGIAQRTRYWAVRTEACHKHYDYYMAGETREEQMNRRDSYEEFLKCSSEILDERYDIRFDSWI